MDRNVILMNRAKATGENGKFSVERGETAVIVLADVHKVPDLKNNAKPEYMVGKKYTDSRDLVKLFDLCKAVSPQPVDITVKRSEDGMNYSLVTLTEGTDED